MTINNKVNMISSKAKAKSKAVAKAVLYISLILLAASCNECPTEPEFDIYLSVEDVFSTSVMIQVTLSDSGQINHFELERNDSTIATYSCLDDDTLITDNELIPDTKYTYQVRFLKDDKTKAQSEAITIHTLPTTSHDFVWEIDTLGLNISTFHDAWVVDEDDIWVVGNIVMPDPDSSWNGTGRETFNAAHWNGKEWELMRLCPQNSYYEAQGIWVFSDDDILITSNGTINHYNGKNVKRLWTIGDWQNGSIGNIWASSPDNIYFVGRKGSIVHYDGNNFKKMDSPTDIDLYSVSGKDNHVFAVGYTKSGPIRSVALELIDDKWEILFESDTYYGNLENNDFGTSTCVKVLKNTAYFYTIQGLVKYHYPHRSVSIDADHYLTSHFYRYISVQNLNDIFLLSGDGRTLHYNGVDWHEDYTLHQAGATFYNGNCYIKGDLIVAVGALTEWSGTRGIIARGFR